MVLGRCMEFLYWIYVSGVLFCSFIWLFIPLYANMARYPNKNDAIILRKSIHFIWLLHYRLMIHLGDVLTVLSFGRQQHNQLSFPVCIHLYRCDGGQGSCFGCWGSSLGRGWGGVLVLESLVRSSLIIGWFMVHGAVWGRIVLCIILGLILISFRRVWILRLKGLMAFSLFSKRFCLLFPWCSYRQGFGGMKWV